MWTDDDIDAALEWQNEQDLRCTGCGHPRDESMSEADDAPDYRAGARQCRACEVREIAAADAHSEARAADTELHGFFFYAEEVT